MNNSQVMEAGKKLALATSNLIQDIKGKPNDTRYATHIKKALTALGNWSNIISQCEQPEVNNIGCPCLYLDEPCHERCTCVNGASSTGCLYCCTYGSLEQRKEKAKKIKEIFNYWQQRNSVNEGVEKAAEEYANKKWDEGYFSNRMAIAEDFIAGAQWQASQTKEDAEIDEDRTNLKTPKPS